MAEVDSEIEFQRIINFNYAPDAAADPRMRNLVSWILYKDESMEMEAGKDFYTMMKFFRDKYGLDQEGFDQAMELCETSIVEEMQHGQA